MEERRKSARRRVLKGAKIVFNNRSGLLDCTVRNLSDGGAQLLLGSTVGLPDSFELLIEPDGVRHFCRVVWRKEGVIGVRFADVSKQ